MADIQISGKSRHSTPRVDLTPMVDLGFILITFFIYTTTIAKPKVMDINMPYKPAPDEAITAFIDTSTITIIPIENGRLLYYEGEFQEIFSFATFPEIRTIIINKTKQLEKLPNSFSKEAHQLHVIIKPNDNCNYESFVRLMDEMLINNVPYYAIANLSEQEREKIILK